MELYSEADKTIWEEKYMPVSLKKGQKVSLTKGNPGLKNVVVGIGWDINAFDTGGDFDLDAAAFCLTDSGRVSDSNDFVFYGNLVHPSGAVQHMGDNLTGAGDGDDEQIKIDLSKIPANRRIEYNSQHNPTYPNLRIRKMYISYSSLILSQRVPNPEYTHFHKYHQHV